MPTPAHNFEEAVALLDNSPNPMALATAPQILIFHEGLLDLAQRVAHLEQSYLEAKFRLDAAEAKNIELNKRVDETAAGYAEYQKRVVVVEQAPNANAQRLDALEPRVRAVEGAVGSKNVAQPEVVVVTNGKAETPHPTLGQRLGIT
jgi:hypothetical protein